MSRTLLIAVTVPCLCALSAEASITYNTVSRTLLAQCTAGPNLNGSNTTPGAWNQALFSLDSSSVPPGTDPNSASVETGAGWAVQDSTLGFASIQAYLVAKAWDGRQGFGGAADSALSTTFVLDVPTTCTLTGSWSTNYFPQEPGGAPASNFQFSGPSGLLAVAGFSPSSPSVLSGPIAFSGTLAPGTYTLTASAQYNYLATGFIGGSRTMTMDFSMSIPAPAAGGALLASAAVCGCRRRRTRRAS